VGIDSLIDDTDREIMSILQKNSRVTNTEIARRLDISEGTVRHRIKKLVDERIIRNIAVVNPETLGYGVHVYIGIQVEYKKLAKVTKQLKEKAAIHFLGYVSGRYDLMVIAFFRNTDEQVAFFTNELAGIDGIERLETFTVLKMLKTKYLWGVSVAGFKEYE